MRSFLRPLLPLFAAVAVGYWVVLFVATHVPVTTDLGVNHLDKYVHFGAYALLTFAIGSVLSLWRGYRTSRSLWIWTLAVAYGAFDEYTQQFVPNRTSSRADWYCDAAGAALGLVVLGLAVMAIRACSGSPSSATRIPAGVDAQQTI